jgi:hypothetical protein
MSKQATALKPTDPLLEAFLRARAQAEVDDCLTELLEEHARPVVKGIIRNKLGVTLSASDGRHENQEALEVESDVLAELLIELNQLKTAASDKFINNFRSYVAVVTFHACYKYFRRKNPQRGQLKDRLRYLLNNRPRFSLWQTSDDEWVCGFTEWQKPERQIIRAGQLNQLLNNSHKDSLAVEDLGAGSRLEELVPAVLKCAGRPVEFDELVDAIAELQGIKKEHDKTETDDEDGEQELARIPDPRPDVEAEAEQRIYLQKLWTEICQLPLRQRAALMLNLKDAKGRGMISMFPLMGIAGIEQIAAALEMQPGRFAELWNDLPWEDTQIAEQLNITRQQVVNLRKCARERLSRRMKGF